ncbi:hypothetical protein KAFR_0C00180 [Kazachstania africana CBS 2517]|uniref:Major facilitator superfamily (MFS) profile domain-containing protein n=1 Tax=Kazachstania africana (strain ATCC 22294 / BCRC 22015 / CBS 2517 / CECT 1963 / NBRC 1671 / NRRL Y-8276) TaxID=1071382 RepID=H2ARL3_KAZAF|nr:hypothetical protein KAFR_0C00180 [Kazachstania africana CBS 2517]CCF57013.1 hypothetical protein KAFR_0C00180 [Kazachstania africana CBS 2517]
MVTELDSKTSDSNSHLSSISNKLFEDDSDNFQVAGKVDTVAIMPKKPMKEYLKISVLCYCVAFGGFIAGWDTGSISGITNQTDFLQRFAQHHKDGTYEFSNVRKGLVVGIVNIGAAFGGIILCKLGDVFGRKGGLVCVVCTYMVGCLICITAADKWYQYTIGRIITGMGIGGIAVLSPMLISRKFPKAIRGTLVSCFQLNQTFGIFIAYCTNYGVKDYSNSASWRVPVGLCFAWALILIGGLTFVPESPRYLCENNKIEEAKRSIAMSNKLEPDDPAVQVLNRADSAGFEVERQEGSATWADLFTTRTKVFQRLIMGIMLKALDQLTGDNYFFYYGTSIFKSVGLEDSFETSIILGVINFCSTFLALYIIDHYGRRTCLLWGSTGMTICMCVYASVGVKALYPHGRDNEASKGAGNAMIVFTCFFIFCFATTWPPVCYVIVSETFPMRIRAKGMALATASNWLWGFLISFFTPFINSAIHFAYGYVFMGCLFFSWFYVFFFVPETKGLTLEEVEEMWLDNVLPWKSAEWIPAARRTADFNEEEFRHDHKAWYKALLSK